MPTVVWSPRFIICIDGYHGAGIHFINLYAIQIMKRNYANKYQTWGFLLKEPILQQINIYHLVKSVQKWHFDPLSNSFISRVGKNIAKMSFWKRRTANITDYDPTYRVVYLGNVLTGWAKGKKATDIERQTCLQQCPPFSWNYFSAVSILWDAMGFLEDAIPVSQ